MYRLHDAGLRCDDRQLRGGGRLADVYRQRRLLRYARKGRARGSLNSRLTSLRFCGVSGGHVDAYEIRGREIIFYWRGTYLRRLYPPFPFVSLISRLR